MTPLRREPAAPRSRVKHSTIEPLRSQKEENISIQKVNEMGGSHNQYMHGSRKFLQRGSNSDNLFFLFDEGEDQNTTSHHRPTSETPFKWRFAGEPMMAQH